MAQQLGRLPRSAQTVISAGIEAVSALFAPPWMQASDLGLEALNHGGDVRFGGGGKAKWHAGVLLSR